MKGFQDAHVSTVVNRQQAEVLIKAGYATMADIAQHGSIPVIRGVGEVTRQKLERWFANKRIPLNPAPKTSRTRTPFPIAQEEARALASRGGKAAHVTGTAHGVSTSPAVIEPISGKRTVFDPTELSKVFALLAAARVIANIEEGYEYLSRAGAIKELMNAVHSFFPENSPEWGQAWVMSVWGQANADQDIFPPEEIIGAITLFEEYLKHKFGKP